MKNIKKATFGGGCFWCIEAIIQKLKGVEKVVSGYAGDKKYPNPTYSLVCSGTTDHAEVVQVTFDANVISYQELLRVFMTSHDPTTLNRQGADSGTQYRSIILYHNDQQKNEANEVLNEMTKLYRDNGTVVTQLIGLHDTFYAAELGHQNYYNNNARTGYCRVIIEPKLNKLRKMHAEKLAI